MHTKQRSGPATALLCSLVAGLWLALASGLPAQESSAGLAPALRLIDAWLDAQRDYDQLPGLSAGVVVDQELVWAAAYGLANPDSRVQAKTNTIYSICSISKLFTSVAILQLRDAGKLQLDDKIEELLPSYNLQQKFADSGAVTLRSLLTHSSGLPRESDIPYWTGPEFPFPTREEVRARLGEQETLYPAATYFQYSNLGMILLGEVVAELSGEPFETYVERNILQPLRMSDTRTTLPDSLWGTQLAVGHSARKRDGNRDRVPMFQARGAAAAFGLSSTVEDLARFASWQFRLLSSGEDEILRASTLREMHRVQWLDPDWETAWGLGFSVIEEEGRSIVRHGGWCPGYRSDLAVDLKNQTATLVMTNASGVSPSVYARGMRSLLGKARKAQRREGAPSEAQLQDYVGRYDEQPWSGEIAVEIWNGDLALLGLPTHSPADACEIVRHSGGDTFRRVRDDGALGEEAVFERDAAGKVTKLWRHSNYSRRLP
jgi:CubicO group peptidase (beta-lactamase class C family)